MAYTILRSSHQNRAIQVLGLFSLLMMIQKGGAYEFKIGGSQGWTVPTDPNALHYNPWAEKNRFQIGDTLLFVYPADKDSVLLVNQDDYTNCNTDSSIEKYSDGHTVYTLKQSGPHYFISGVKDNCLKNEKMMIVVLADRSNQSSNTNQTSLASPPPSESSENVPPSPAPSGEESPPPPSVPTPAPSSEETPPPPPSAASSIVLGFIGSVGAFVGSSLLLVF